MSIPSGWREVLYIKSTSIGPWINTGYIPSVNTKIEMDCEVPSPVNTYDTPMGARASQDFFIAYNGGTFRYVFGGSNQNVGNMESYYNTRILFTLDKSKCALIVNGEEVLTRTFSQNSLNCNTPIGLFTLQTGNGSDLGSCRALGTLYRFRIYENDILTADFVPVANSNNVAGLCDIISGNLATIINGSFTFEELPNTYTVNFNSNGGSGTMEPQDIEIDVPTPLTPNSYIKPNYQFYGWSTTPSGNVEYSNGESVTNLAPLGESITLYAVWGIPRMEIIIQRNNSEKNKLDKDITTIISLSGTLKNETSIIDPVIIIAGNLETLANANYMEIPAFKRKYFITNIRTIRNGIIEISAHVDVLSSFATEIRSNRAIVHKQENEWNLYLNDGTFKIYSDMLIETYLFPASFPGTFSYVLAVAGGGSSANE